MNISLSPEQEQMIAQRIESGRYQSASAVIDKALLLLDLQEDNATEDFALLRAEIQKGIDQSDRGEVEALDISAIKREGRQVIARRELR